jgi:hypothetical protein
MGEMGLRLCSPVMRHCAEQISSQGQLQLTLPLTIRHKQAGIIPVIRASLRKV